MVLIVSGLQMSGLTPGPWGQRIKAEQKSSFLLRKSFIHTNHIAFLITHVVGDPSSFTFTDNHPVLGPWRVFSSLLHLLSLIKSSAFVLSSYPKNASPTLKTGACYPCNPLPLSWPPSFWLQQHKVLGKMSALIIIFKISAESVYTWNFLITLMSFQSQLCGPIMCKLETHYSTSKAFLSKAQNFITCHNLLNSELFVLKLTFFCKKMSKDLNFS